MELEILAEETAQAGTEESATSTEETKEEVSAEEAARAAEGEESAASEEEDKPETGGKRNAQERIRQLTAQREEERRAREEAEKREAYYRGLAERGGKTEEVAKPVVTEPEFPGRPEQYNTYDDYLYAKFEWKQDQKSRQAMEEQREGERLTKVRSQADEAKKKYPDFLSVIHNPSIARIPQATAVLIQDSDVGAEIVYYLGKNPKEAERIASLHPFVAAKEIGKLEDRISNPPKIATKTVSQAPEPLKTVSDGASAADVDLDKLSMEDFVKRRNAQSRR